MRVRSNRIESDGIGRARIHLLVVFALAVVERGWFQEDRVRLGENFVTEQHRRTGERGGEGGEGGENALELDPPGGSEDVDGLGEDVVVDQAGVDGEETHEEDDVPATEEDRPDLLIAPFVLQLFLLDDHPQGEESDDQSVACIAEHHGEEEGKGDDQVRHRIHLSVRSHAVRVDQILKASRQFIQLVRCGGRLRRRNLVQHRQGRLVATLVLPRQRERGHRLPRERREEKRD